MNRFSIAFIAILSIVAMAGEMKDPKGFPECNFLHAHCQMHTKFTNWKCEDVYVHIDQLIKGWHPEPSSKGLYEIKSDEFQDYLWITRTTPVMKYVDDILFKFEDVEGACMVESKSRSRSLSVYDYDTNYCNMWNVFRYVGGNEILNVKNCYYRPTPGEEAEKCEKY
jgi:hypothetical protein